MYMEFVLGVVGTIISLYIVSCRSNASDLSVTVGVDATEYYPGVIQLVTPHGGICTGSVISHNAVLTAAYCIKRDEGGINPIAVLDNGTKIESVKGMYNPKYDYIEGPTQKRYDLAVVFFADHSFDKITKYKIKWGYKLNEGDSVVMVGYGCKTTTISADGTDASMICGSDSDKNHRIKRSGVNKIVESDIEGVIQVDVKEFKADDETIDPTGENVSSSSGDSGGPLFWKYSNLIIGVSSTGDFFVEPNEPVSSYFVDLNYPDIQKFFKQIQKEFKIDFGL